MQAELSLPHLLSFIPVLIAIQHWFCPTCTHSALHYNSPSPVALLLCMPLMIAIHRPVLPCFCVFCCGLQLTFLFCRASVHSAVDCNDHLVLPLLVAFSVCSGAIASQ